MSRRLLAACVIILLLGIPADAGWLRAEGGQMPANAIVAGKNHNGLPLYVCRGEHEGGLYPGILDETSLDCSIHHGGREFLINDFEVLTGEKYKWISVFNGEIPFDALQAGKGLEGNSIYVCRGEMDSVWRPGTISQADDGCRVLNAGKEQTALWYEVLVGE